MELIIQIILTIIIGLITGFIGAITGSGGVISIPFLIFLGLPPATAIATERFSSLGQNIATIREFIKKKKIIWEYFLPFTIIILITTLINTFMLISASEMILKFTIIALMILALIIVLVFPKIGIREKETSKKKKIQGYSMLGITTFFSGFIGGLGILKYILISYFFGTTYIKANATQRIPWAISVFITTVFLLFKGYVSIYLGIALFIGYFIGGHIGAITEIRKGDTWVKKVFIIIIILSLIKYIFF